MSEIKQPEPPRVESKTPSVVQVIKAKEGIDQDKAPSNAEGKTVDRTVGMTWKDGKLVPEIVVASRGPNSGGRTWGEMQAAKKAVQAS